MLFSKFIAILGSQDHLKVTELEEADTYWVKREQKVVNLSSKDAQQLGLSVMMI